MEKYQRRNVMHTGSSLLIFILLVFLLQAIFFSGSIPNTFDSCKSHHFKNFYNIFKIFWTNSAKVGSNEGKSYLRNGRGGPVITQAAAKSMKLHLRKLVPGPGKHRSHFNSTGFYCHTDLHTGQCVTNKPAVINIQEQIIYIPSSDQAPLINRTIRPYPRREEAATMNLVTPIQILHGNITPPKCQVYHSVPAMVFSTRGLSGNLFHEFNEIIIPLFITARHFHSQVQFLIVDYFPWWVKKYDRIVKGLSGHKVLNGNKYGGEAGTIHCFPGVVLGVRYHGNLEINKGDTPKGNSMVDFKNFLSEAYNLKRGTVLKHKKPLLLLISRRKTRIFLNEHEMVTMMQQLGFLVRVASPDEAPYLEKFSEVVNSCDVMVGAHGAGITNQVFLPSGAVVLQLVPIGLEWASEYYFGKPSQGMGLKYLEYKIDFEESSLSDTYTRDDPVISDPGSMWAKGYMGARAVYVDGQNMRINLERFNKTLKEALEHLGQS